MKTAKTFILYSTLAMMFGTAAYFYAGSVMIQAFYLLIPINLFLMLLMRRLWVPVAVFIFFGFLIVSGAIGVLQHTDTVGRFAKEFVGIGVSAIYFCCFFRTFDFNLEACFRLYARMAYWVAILGFVLFPVYYFLLGEYRLRSILYEPSMFVLTCIPALYYFADQWLRRRRHGRELAVMLAAFLLAGSANGFLGMLFGILIFALRYRRSRIWSVVLIPALAAAIYTTSSDVSQRFDDTYRSLATGDVRDVNLSSYALLTNLFVTRQVLQVHPVMGNGLGSHGISYDQYSGNLEGIEQFSNSIFDRLNAEDANSLGLRVLSDMGIVGACLVLWCIWRYRPRGQTELDFMNQAIWLYFFLKLLRAGHYFSNEQFFFIVFYGVSYFVSRKRAAVPGAVSAAAPAAGPARHSLAGQTIRKGISA